MTYPMWNLDKTGILVKNDQGGVVFLEGGPEFRALKKTAKDWAESEPDVATPEEIAAAIVSARAAMVISPMQGILTLGETEWGKVLAYRDGPLSTWAQKVIIDSALDWRRNSQNIAFFGFLLGYTAEQMDALFIAAAQVRA